MTDDDKKVVLALAYCSTHLGEKCLEECPYYEKGFSSENDCMCQLMIDAIDCIVEKGD